MGEECRKAELSSRELAFYFHNRSSHKRSAGCCFVASYRSILGMAWPLIGDGCGLIDLDHVAECQTENEFWQLIVVIEMMASFSTRPQAI